MKQITLIGLDLAKNVFQLHGVDAGHRPVLRRQWGTRYGTVPLKAPMAISKARCGMRS